MVPEYLGSMNYTRSKLRELTRFHPEPSAAREGSSVTLVNACKLDLFEEEISDGGSDVFSSHQGFSDEYCTNARLMEPFDVG